ncbi:MAG TPA: DinB family protein [Thermoanaerobaculia bacterium]|nr:DinB family protein [Thermoanaerobaculia bacterium]
MSELGENLALLLTRELATFERELDLFPDDASAWGRAPGVSNAAANLALHVAGNLQHFVGTVLGGTGYVRDREREFGRRDGPREDVKRELRAAARAVSDVLPGLPADRLSAEYPEPVNGMRLRTDRFLMHLAAHAAYHLGQASTARRTLTGDARSSGPVPLAPLAAAPSR